MILELGMILTALYAFTKKPVSKEAALAVTETKTKTEEKEETQPAAPIGLQSVFKESKENILLNPAISKMMGTGESLASQFTTQSGVFSDVASLDEIGPGAIGGIVGMSLSGQSDWTQPYSGYIQSAASLVESVFPSIGVIPLVGTVIGGFLEGILAKDVQMTIPTANFQFIREFENQRIIQGLSKFVHDEPYKTMVEKGKKQIIEDYKKNQFVDITSISSLPYPSFIWQNYIPWDWEWNASGNVINMDLKNQKVWTEKNGFYLLNLDYFSALLNKYPYAKDTGISEDDWQSANILWNVMGFPVQIKKDPIFGMIDPRSQVFYNQYVIGQWTFLTEGGYQSYGGEIPLDVPVYRDNEGNMINSQSKQIWGKFQTGAEVLKQFKPEEYQQYIVKQETLKKNMEGPFLSLS